MLVSNIAHSAAGLGVVKTDVTFEEQIDLSFPGPVQLVKADGVRALAFVLEAGQVAHLHTAVVPDPRDALIGTEPRKLMVLSFDSPVDVTEVAT